MVALELLEDRALVVGSVLDPFLEPIEVLTNALDRDLSWHRGGLGLELGKVRLDDLQLGAELAHAVKEGSVSREIFRRLEEGEVLGDRPLELVAPAPQRRQLSLHLRLLLLELLLKALDMLHHELWRREDLVEPAPHAAL
ncbi:hypothetical protein [Polyangium mundeleinium]|uniref:Uncharacterized protein n=1 Tax=Polyangium mundeleinium TaxID=2995306 RepID=A0ABT5EMV8_9BACT|nr:hypothetical protein [Polyangium mundeleinium]MDC0743164.1 hypothetical protein [Polyangium mundeleinium]